jgi:transposase
MNALDLCQIILNTDRYEIKQIQIKEWKIHLLLESNTKQTNCPACKQPSTQVHSHYWRYPNDLAWADFSITWNLLAKRFFCNNRNCPKRTFAEQHPEILAPYARRTNRLNEKQQLVGVNICARAAEHLLHVFHIGISDTTVIRLIRAIPEIEQLAIRVLGVDDWAKRKGQRYGTLLVDLEQGICVDLLEDRSTEVFSSWLAQHPGIEIISRDRAKAYANAIDLAAPDAIQVADRWHLLKNCTDTVIKVLQREYSSLKKQFKQLQLREKKADVEPIELSPPEPEPLTRSEQRRQERIQTVLELKRQGMPQNRIAQELSINRKTVRRYLRAPDARNRRRKRFRLLDPYRSYIRKRWAEGCHNGSQIFREIKAMGYPGQATMLREFLKPLRRMGHLSQDNRLPSLPRPQALAWWILKPPEDLDDSLDQLLDQLISTHPKLAVTSKLARDFSSMIRNRQSEALDDWLDQADRSGDRLWGNFAVVLKQDYAAVQAALELPWSNGPTEGHINRLKCLKRQMYGRAKDDLLRKRVIWQGRWSFT